MVRGAGLLSESSVEWSARVWRDPLRPLSGFHCDRLRRAADHLRQYILENDGGLRFERATATATAAFMLEVADA
jgi:hypothetical protein